MWIQESNREKHLVYAIPCGILFGFLFVAGLGAGMEFKDKQYGGKWDWLDFAATMIGGAIGELIRLIIIYFILHGSC